SARPILGDALWRRHGGIARDDRRAGVSITEHEAERTEFRRLLLVDGDGRTGPRLGATRAVFLQFRYSELIAQGGHVLGRGLEHAAVPRPALQLVAFEQLRAAPALQRRGELPTEIDAVADAEIHAMAAERRVQMAGV